MLLTVVNAEFLIRLISDWCWSAWSGVAFGHQARLEGYGEQILWRRPSLVWHLMPLVIRHVELERQRESPTLRVSERTAICYCSCPCLLIDSMAIYDHYDQEMFQFRIKNGEEHPDQWTLKYMQVSSLLKSLLGTYEIDPHVPGLLHSVDRWVAFSRFGLSS